MVAHCSEAERTGCFFSLTMKGAATIRRGPKLAPCLFSTSEKDESGIYEPPRLRPVLLAPLQPGWIRVRIVSDLLIKQVSRRSIREAPDLIKHFFLSLTVVIRFQTI